MWIKECQDEGKMVAQEVVFCLSVSESFKRVLKIIEKRLSVLACKRSFIKVPWCQNVYHFLLRTNTAWPTGFRKIFPKRRSLNIAFQSLFVKVSSSGTKAFITEDASKSSRFQIFSFFITTRQTDFFRVFRLFHTGQNYCFQVVLNVFSSEKKLVKVKPWIISLCMID